MHQIEKKEVVQSGASGAMNKCINIELHQIYFACTRCFLQSGAVLRYDNQ